MKVKVNRVRGGSMGDQRNYGLVTGSIWNYEDKPSTNEVSDTLGPVDRDQATIEAERGETVIYPDSDGQITHAKIGGKRHTHGGTPLDIPDGAFVFSDTRALLIKNKELLKNIFGMNTNKAVTPAKVAKRYDLNQYKDILNDPEADFLSKKTAQLMLENNLKKLGQLALVQEGMKGFPDGIPDIALPLFGSDIAVAKPMEQMPQAKFGGQIMRRGGRILPIHQDVGTVKKGDTIYINGQPVKIKNRYSSTWGNDYFEFEKPINISVGDHPDKQTVERMRVDDVMKGLNSGHLAMDWGAGFSGLGQDMVDISSTNMPDVNFPGYADKYADVQFSLTSKPTVVYTKPKVGFQFMEGNRTYEVVDPNVYDDKKPYVQVKLIDNPDRTLSSKFRWTSNIIPLDEFRKTHMSNQKTQQQQQQEANKQVQDMSRAEAYNSGDDAILGAWWNANKDAILNTINQVKNRTMSVGDVAKLFPDYLYYLDKENLIPKGAVGYGSSKAKPAAAPANNSSTQSKTARTTTPKTTRTSSPPTDDEIIQNMIEMGWKKEDITQQDIQNQKKGIQGQKEGGVTYVFDPTNNIMLDRYQSNGTVKKKFNIYDKNFRDYAGQNKLKIVLPDWATGQTYIGSQNPSVDPTFKKSATGEIIPATGIDKYTGPDDLIKWHKSQGMDFSKYVDADGNAAKDEADGMTKFKDDLKSWDNSGKKHRHATSWMLGKVDEINLERATKLGLPAPPSQTDKGVTGWDVTGFDVLTGTKYLAPEDTPPSIPPGETPKPKYKCVDGKAVETTDGTGFDTAEEALKNCGVPEQGRTPQYTSGYPGRWSDYSEFNLATAMGMANQVEPGALPAFTQVFPDLGRPVFVDPTASAMRQLSLQNQQAEMIAGMSDPTVGRANIIASAAKTADPLSDIMAKYDQANAQIANTFEGQRAAMTNEAQVRTAAMRKQFQDELVTRRQNYLNAQKEAAANVAYQYERGAKDFAERNALNVQNPNYGIDPYGRVFFKPGYNPNATASSTTTDLLDNYINNYNIDPNKAAALVAAQMKLNDNAFNYDPMSSIWGSQKPVS